MADLTAETPAPALSKELRDAVLKSIDELRDYLDLKRKALGKTADDQMFVDDLQALLSVADTMLMNLRQRGYRADDTLREPDGEQVIIVADRVNLSSPCY